MTTEILRAQIKTPMSKDNPKDVKVESIPLPPQSMWSELDNSVPTEPAESQVEIEASAPVVSVALTGEREIDVPLSFPFPYGDRQVTKITVRRLTLGEVQDLLRERTGKTLTTIDIYAKMTGYPVDVLRSLDDDDGHELFEKAYDFLPRRFREEVASSAT